MSATTFHVRTVEDRRSVSSHRADLVAQMAAFIAAKDGKAFVVNDATGEVVTTITRTPADSGSELWAMYAARNATREDAGTELACDLRDGGATTADALDVTRKLGRLNYHETREVAARIGYQWPPEKEYPFDRRARDRMREWDGDPRHEQEQDYRSMTQ